MFIDMKNYLTIYKNEWEANILQIQRLIYAVIWSYLRIVYTVQYVFVIVRLVNLLQLLTMPCDLPISSTQQSFWVLGLWNSSPIFSCVLWYFHNIWSKLFFSDMNFLTNYVMITLYSTSTMHIIFNTTLSICYPLTSSQPTEPILSLSVPRGGYSTSTTHIIPNTTLHTCYLLTSSQSTQPILSLPVPRGS